jgi:hypothetical protein
VQRHGWFIQGLDRAGESWNGTSPTGILKDQVPGYVQDLFEKRLDGKGFGLHELAVLGATIEHLVHNEALAKLGSAFTIHDHLPTMELDADEANEVLETYMASYILGQALNSTMRSLTLINRLKERMSKIYLAWPETQVFIRDVTDSIAGGAHTFDFAMVARIAETMGEQFGKFQAKECDSLKDNLLKVEDRSSGRVRLADFYKPANLGQDGAWQFRESVPYLRQIGALDESAEEDPKVIVTNYLNSQANCIASSSFYTVCCMDECESLLTHLENDIRASEAAPARILDLVSALPSATVAAPRELSSTLRRRLDDIAETHGGTVPLHGRLFGQWMHNVYPRECPYPHISGVTAPVSALDFKKESGEEHTASKDDIERIVNESQAFRSASSSNVTEDEIAELMPWSIDEELLVVRTAPDFATGDGSSILHNLRNMLVFAVAVSIALGLTDKKIGGKLSPSPGENVRKFYV